MDDIHSVRLYTGKGWGFLNKKDFLYNQVNTPSIFLHFQNTENTVKFIVFRSFWKGSKFLVLPTTNEMRSHFLYIRNLVDWRCSIQYLSGKYNKKYAHHFVVVTEETMQSIFPIHIYTSDRAHLHISASRDQGYF